MSLKSIYAESLSVPMNRNRNWFGSLSLVFAVGLLHSLAIAQDNESPATDDQSPSVEATEVERIELQEPDVEVATEEAKKPAPRPKKKKQQYYSNNNSSLVSIRKDGYLAADRSVEEMVTILGKSHAEGEVERELVTILGNIRMDGSVGREMVTILGNAYVNGPVGREVVVVLGNLELGPKAEVRDITVVAGTIKQDPEAIVTGSFTEVPIYIPFITDGWEEIHPYIYQGLALGRFVVPSIGWSWMMALVALGGLLLLAAAFPKPAVSCVNAMEDKPALSIVSGFAFHLVGSTIISIIAILLVATGIGILALPFLGMALLFMWLLSFIAVYGVIGRRFGARDNVAIATLIGGILATLSYAVPVLGFLVVLGISVVGAGAVIVSTFSALSKNGARDGNSKPAASSYSQDIVTEEPKGFQSRESFSDSDVYTDEAEELFGEPEVGVVFEPVGFGPRFLALVIDFVVVVISLVSLEAFGGIDLMDNFLLPWLGYHLGFWMWRGTTVGGLALGLKIERTNGEELNFGVVLVRSLASIISFICLGLGFYWASWDAERQSWHDKISGTVIVRVPKGVSLI